MKHVLCLVAAAGLLCSLVSSGFSEQGSMETSQKADKKAAIPALRGQKVVAVDELKQCITLSGADGAAQEVAVTPETKVKKGKEIIKLSDIQPGDNVTVFLKKTEGDKPQASTITVHKPKAEAAAGKKGKMKARN